MSVDDTIDVARLELVKTVEQAAQGFDRAKAAATREALEAAMNDFIATERDRNDGFVASGTVKEKRAFLETQARDALQAAARRYQDDRAAALETIAVAERASETLPHEVDTLDKSASDTLRYAARTAVALEEANLRASLDGVTYADLVTVYERAVARKDRIALRFLEGAHANGWKGISLSKSQDDDTIPMMRLAQGIKAQQAARHPAWCADARARLAPHGKATTTTLLQLVAEGRTAI